MLGYDNYIFDFGGVFIEIDYYATKLEFEKLGLNKFDREFSQEQQSQIFDHYETGQLSSQRFVNSILEKLPIGTSPNMVVGAWNAMLGNIIEKNVLYAHQLRKNGKNLFLLSNTNEIHIKEAFSRWQQTRLIQPDELFNKVYLSHELGLRKPNREIYDFVIKENDLNVDNTIFVDDSIQHVLTARNLGIRSECIASNQDLEVYLS